MHVDRLIMAKKIHPLIMYGVPILLAAILKGFVIPVGTTPFNADEAIVALMARHINQGQLPAFFYGQYYMGSLDAMLIAVFFRILGEHVWVIRVVQSILYLGTVATTVLLASKVIKNDRAAFYAGLLVALPTVNVTLYSTVSLGGYGEMLLIGNLLLLGGIGVIDQLQVPQKTNAKVYWCLVAWGFGAGFAFWVVGLTLVYSLPVIIGLVWLLIKKNRDILLPGLFCLGIGGILGSSPWWGSALIAGNLDVITELAGGAISGVSEGSRLILPLKRLGSLIVFGGSAATGMRPPWSVRWLMLPALPLILIFWMAVLYDSFKKLIRERLNSYFYIFGLMGLILAAGFIFSPYGDDPSGRYFLPLMIPMSLFAANMIVDQVRERKYLEFVLIGFLLLFNLGGLIQSLGPASPGLTTQFDPVAQVDHSRMKELIEFLRENSITAGYSNYWVSYPLAFLSQEEIIFIPRLPYHEDFRYTARDDRYPPYTELVDSSLDISYITTHHEDLNKYLEDQFDIKGITWQKETIGDYTVYYQLSSPVRVEELGLGETTQP